jgi:hypothetical protein
MVLAQKGKHFDSPIQMVIKGIGDKPDNLFPKQIRQGWIAI